MYIGDAPYACVKSDTCPAMPPHASFDLPAHAAKHWSTAVAFACSWLSAQQSLPLAVPY